MKLNALSITAIIFLIIVNTNYFWEGTLGFLAFPIIILLVIIYFIIGIIFLIQLFFAFSEKFNNKNRLLNICIVFIVLVVTIIEPNGLINFDKLQGKDILVAEREGAANCMTTLKLKENNKFIQRNVCFGISETKGNYQIINDTIFFKNISFNRSDKDYYKFAIINEVESVNKKYIGFLELYKSQNDTNTIELGITKNELIKGNSQQ